MRFYFVYTCSLSLFLSSSLSRLNIYFLLYTNLKYAFRHHLTSKNIMSDKFICTPFLRSTWSILCILLKIFCWEYGCGPWGIKGAFEVVDELFMGFFYFCYFMQSFLSKNFEGFKLEVGKWSISFPFDYFLPILVKIFKFILVFPLKNPLRLK